MKTNNPCTNLCPLSIRRVATKGILSWTAFMSRLEWQAWGPELGVPIYCNNRLGVALLGGLGIVYVLICNGCAMFGLLAPASLVTVIKASALTAMMLLWFMVAGCTLLTWHEWKRFPNGVWRRIGVVHAVELITTLSMASATVCSIIRGTALLGIWSLSRGQLTFMSICALISYAVTTISSGLWLLSRQYNHELAKYNVEALVRDLP